MIGEWNVEGIGVIIQIGIGVISLFGGSGIIVKVIQILNNKNIKIGLEILNTVVNQAIVATEESMGKDQGFTGQEKEENAIKLVRGHGIKYTEERIRMGIRSSLIKNECGRIVKSRK